MALRKILTQGDPTLNKKSRPVERFDERLHILLDDMKETLAAANGAGLAAPQVGILRRVVVVVDADDHMVELVNPELVYTEGEQTGLEGCLVRSRKIWPGYPSVQGQNPRSGPQWPVI